MGKILQFKSCAVGGEFTKLGAQTPSSYGICSVQSPANIVSHIASCYANDPNLAGKVTGIGYGWQQYTIPSSGNIKFTVRGGAGGSTGKNGYTIDPETGVVSGSGNRPGRGAKICGSAKLKKDDIIYILVGFRGWSNNGSDWGSCGGGASVVLLDNPSGQYTFGPLNRKVDVLFVAGGGGGCFDQSFGSAYYGGDAAFTDGINTNGGSNSGRSPGSGAGLTGNGTTEAHGHIAYSLLSGSVYGNYLNTAHGSTWGGGGASCNGGGRRTEDTLVALL